ncbi:MAG: hypothetical protein R3Y68_00610 [Rikenellaceae bacterium]
MKKIISSTLLALTLIASTVGALQAEEIQGATAVAQEAIAAPEVVPAAATATKSKPTVNVGLLLHTYLQMEQNGYGANVDDMDDIDSPGSFNYGANLYRARLLFDAKLTERDYIFVDTELTASVGLNGDKSASIKILDAQYEHIFSDALRLSAGKMLVSFNRNGLQTPNTLMASDYALFQSAYNLTESQPLQNDSGRDVGINLAGSFYNGRLTYRAGAFSGCRDYTYLTGEESAPFRYVGRLQYNFFDTDNYAGTLLGEGKTLSVAAGVDNQGSYYAVGADLFLDAPLGSAGSLTLNSAYAYMSGGSYSAKYNFSSVIADSNIILAEGGYYFKSLKLQPWVKFERMDRRIRGLDDETVFGGGVNYFFNGYGSNLKLSYLSRKNSGVGKYYGQAWLQLQVYIF